MAQPKKEHKGIVNRLTLTYIRRIKKWMFCPACQNGKMTINQKSTVWTCEDCGYSLLAEEFEDDYVFWFCDECNAYLNNQEGYDRQAAKHICRNCGYENDTTLDNVKGICSDCGKIISNPEGTLCLECIRVRKQNAKKWLITAGKVVGAVAVVAGAAYLAMQATDDEEKNDYIHIIGGNDDEGGTTMSFDYSDKWFKSATDSELDIEREKVRVVYTTAGRDGISDKDCDRLYSLLHRFDIEMSDRAWGGRKDYGHPVPREHGWYLLNDD